MSNRYRKYDDRSRSRSSSNTTRLLTLCFILIFLAAAAVSFVYLVIEARRPTIGINYGRVADDLPSPSEVVAILKKLKIGKVKMYDANPQVLSALANSGLQVSIMATNQEVEGVGSNQQTSDEWVQKNVVSWYKSVNIIMVIIGNEILSDYGNQALWNSVVPAMRNIRASLVKVKLRNIMVTSSVAVDCLASSFPPSNGTFRQDISSSVILPMLEFLSSTNSYFFINVYPYFAWASNPKQISLSYATFGSSGVVVYDGSFRYSNLLDAQLDALVTAMAKLGYHNVKIAISETGWPTLGDPNQPGTNVSVAADYNRRLVRKALWRQRGTPRRPGKYIPTYIFALFNENLKPGPTVERNWGLLYPNGTRIYEIDLTGRQKDSDYAFSPSMPFQVTLPSVSSTSSSPGNSSSHASALQSLQQSEKWCVANHAVEEQNLRENLDYACSKVDCTAILPGQRCFKPDNVISHASYAFNMLYQGAKVNGGTCSLSGAAILTTIDPSYGLCAYPRA